jgi:hypothetical protein
MVFSELACFLALARRVRESARRIFVEGVSNVSYGAQNLSNVDSSNVGPSDVEPFNLEPSNLEPTRLQPVAGNRTAL